MASRRINLTESTVRALPLAEPGERYRVIDERLPGFWVVVGAQTRTFVARTAVDGKSLQKTIGRYGEVSTRDARARAKEWLGLAANGKVRTPQRVTLRSAWEQLKGRLERRGRSPLTIEMYEYAWSMLPDWMDRPLADLASDPGGVARRHEELTDDRGRIAADRAMRAIRAVHRHAFGHRLDPELPPQPPTSAVEWNGDKRRSTALLPEQAPAWYRQLQAIQNPVRREFHWLLLLTGARPGSLKVARWEDVDLERRSLRFETAKAGRTYAIPLGAPMVESLERVREAGRFAFPDRAAQWVFPADVAQGHLKTHRERRTVLSHVGGDLRQTYRTAAVAAGVSELLARLLMGHSLRGVSEGYVTVDALAGPLLKAQEDVSAEILRWTGVAGKHS